MPVTIILDDELAERLQQQAEARQISLQQWATQVLEREPEFPARSEAWRALNTRRFQLIHQRHHGGLSEADGAELAELQAMADRWLEPIDQKRMERVEEYEQRVQNLTQKSA